VGFQYQTQHEETEKCKRVKQGATAIKAKLTFQIDFRRQYKIGTIDRYNIIIIVNLPSFLGESVSGTIKVFN